MEPFVRQEYIKPSTIEKLTKKNPERNYLVEINNLFADSSLDEISLGQIQALAEKFKIKNAYHKFRVELLQMLNDFLNEHLGNPQSSINDAVNAKKVQVLLGIPDLEFLKEYNSIAIKVFEKQVFETLCRTKKRRDTEESAQFEQLQKQLEISDEDANRVIGNAAQEIIQEFITGILADQRISPDETEALEQLCKDLKIKVQFDEECKGIIEKNKLLWKLENEPLLIYNAEIFLQKGEYCHYKSAASLYEDRKQTTGITYRGYTHRVKIFKGFYYRVGNLNAARKTEDVTIEIDSGILYVTNKRILFNGNKGNKVIRYSQIVDLIPFIDGMKVVKETGKPLTFQIPTNDGEILITIVARLIRESQS